MFKRIALMSIALSLTTAAVTSEASTTLIFKKKAINTVAVNLDWKFREGTVVMHPRNLETVSNINLQTNTPLKWKSQYGSIVFHSGNRFKPGPAASGMNEKGLTASVLFLHTSGYPENKQLPTLNTSQWVKYVLDKFQNVQEVIDDLPNYQLIADNYRGVTMNFHMIINDAEGKSAIIEYLHGKLVIHTTEALSHPALTNTEYDTSVSLLEDYDNVDGKLNLPGGYDSESRFVRAAHYIKRLPNFIAKEEHIAYAFNGLSDVAQAPGTSTPTQLSVVWDIPSKTAYFRSINEAAVRDIALNSINFAELEQPLSLNTFQHLAGDVLSRFQPQNG